MKQLIANIRNKPQHYKNRIIVITIIGIAGFLLILWAIVGMPPRSGSSGDVIYNFNQDLNESKDTLPELFPKE